MLLAESCKRVKKKKKKTLKHERILLKWSEIYSIVT